MSCMGNSTHSTSFARTQWVCTDRSPGWWEGAERAESTMEPRRGWLSFTRTAVRGSALLVTGRTNMPSAVPGGQASLPWTPPAPPHRQSKVHYHARVITRTKTERQTDKPTRYITLKGNPGQGEGKGTIPGSLLASGHCVIQSWEFLQCFSFSSFLILTSSHTFLR